MILTENATTTEQLQYWFDAAGYTRRGSVARQQVVARLRRLSRKPLEDGERREVTARHVTLKVWQRGIGRWYVEVIQYGELLGAYSGSWRTEQDALRSFGSTLCLLANS
jgi:hypothetical protein